jgi:Na+-driven multidrug efflux pump
MKMPLGAPLFMIFPAYTVVNCAAFPVLEVLYELPFCLQLAASALPVIKLAAHQAVWSMYTISSFATATLEQAALAFLPQALTPPERRSLILVTRGLGLLIGAGLGSICWGLSALAPWLFTRDVAVQLQMQRIAEFVGGVMVIVGVDVSAVAVLISMGYSRYLARSFVITLVSVALFMYGLQMRVGTLGLLHVWTSLVFFFAVRCLQSYLGILMLRKRVPQD